MTLPVVEVPIVNLSIGLRLGTSDNCSIHPSSIVSNSIHLSEFTLTIWLIVFELSFISVSVSENLCTLNDLAVLPQSFSNTTIVIRHSTLTVRDHARLLLATILSHLSGEMLSRLDLIVLLLHKLILVFHGFLFPLSFLLDFGCYLVSPALWRDWRQIGFGSRGRSSQCLSLSLLPCVRCLLWCCVEPSIHGGHILRHDSSAVNL